MRAEEVVRYARWLRELTRGKVEVQSRARRSYRAVVIPTDALFALGMLKLASLILATTYSKSRSSYGVSRERQLDFAQLLSRKVGQGCVNCVGVFVSVPEATLTSPKTQSSVAETSIRM